MTDLPYSVEYAKSSRASCKFCKQTIDQGIIRIALMVQVGILSIQYYDIYGTECG